MKGIVAEHLAPAVRLVVGDDAALVDSWRVQTIHRPIVSSTIGVYLFSGTASTEAGLRRWSLILKALSRCPDGAPPVEALVYATDLLRFSPGGLAAPRHYGTLDLSDDHVGIWLEKIEGAAGRRWSRRRLQLHARHLGQLGGAYAASERRYPPWLKARSLHALLPTYAENVARLKEYRDHPLVSRAYPPPVIDGLLSMWQARYDLLSRVDLLSATLCHGDAQPRNLFLRRPPGGASQTVAIDWANAHLGPVGRDLATLVHQSLIYFHVGTDSVAELDRGAFRSYLDGLASTGWSGDVAAVRTAYAVETAFVSGLGEIRPVLRIALEETRHAWAATFYGHSVAEILDRRAAVGNLQIGLAHEAGLG